MIGGWSFSYVNFYNYIIFANIVFKTKFCLCLELEHWPHWY